MCTPYAQHLIGAQYTRQADSQFWAQRSGTILLGMCAECLSDAVRRVFTDCTWKVATGSAQVAASDKLPCSSPYAAQQAMSAGLHVTHCERLHYASAVYLSPSFHFFCFRSGHQWELNTLDTSSLFCMAVNHLCSLTHSFIHAVFYNFIILLLSFLALLSLTSVSRTHGA